MPGMPRHCRRSGPRRRRIVRSQHQHEHQRVFGPCPGAGAAGRTGDHEAAGENLRHGRLGSVAWSQCTHLSRGAATWRPSRSPARMATSAVASASVRPASSPGVTTTRRSGSSPPAPGAASDRRRRADCPSRGPVVRYCVTQRPAAAPVTRGCGPTGTAVGRGRRATRREGGSRRRGRADRSMAADVDQELRSGGPHPTAVTI